MGGDVSGKQRDSVIDDSSLGEASGFRKPDAMNTDLMSSFIVKHLH